MEALVIKGIINIAGIAVGALCIWIGYRLYIHGVVEKGKASAEGVGFKVMLASYGPGVVFALFGAFIVIFSLTRSMSLRTTETWSGGGRSIEAVAIEEVASGSVEAAAEAGAAPVPSPHAPDRDPAAANRAPAAERTGTYTVELEAVAAADSAAGSDSAQADGTSSDAPTGPQ